MTRPAAATAAAATVKRLEAETKAALLLLLPVVATGPLPEEVPVAAPEAEGAPDAVELGVRPLTEGMGIVPPLW